MKKAFLILFFSLAIVPAFNSVAQATEQGGTVDSTTKSNVDVTTKTSDTHIVIVNPFKSGIGDSLPKLFQTILEEVLLPLGGMICVFGFIYAGFLYVTAQGNTTQIANANRALLYAAVGTAVLLGSWVIAKAICSTIFQLGGPACPS